MTQGRKPRLAWAVSGQGRAVAAVLDAIDGGLVAAELALIVVDRPSPAEALAQARNIECLRLETVEAPYHPGLVQALREHAIDWLGLTFNRLLSGAVITALDGRVINLHMSLLPLFPGFGALRSSVRAGMRMTGVTVHLVDAGMDTGPILAQATCPVGAAEEESVVGRRQFDVALPLLLQVVRSIADGELGYDPARGVTWERTLRAETVTPCFPVVDDDLVAFSAAFCGRLPT